MLVRVCSCQNTTLLEITCRGSFFVAVGVHNLEYDTYLSGCSEI